MPGEGRPDVVMLEDPTVTQFAVTGDLVTRSPGADKLPTISPPVYGTSCSTAASRTRCHRFPVRNVLLATMRYSRRPVSCTNGHLGRLLRGGQEGQAIVVFTHDQQFRLQHGIPALHRASLAGRRPALKVDGENLTIDMTKDSAEEVHRVPAEPSTNLIDNTKTANWSDDQPRVNDGTASLDIGGWMLINLMNGAPDQAGNWRVAQLPQWEEGEEASAEDGGSALAVVSPVQAAGRRLQVRVIDHGARAPRPWPTPVLSPSLKHSHLPRTSGTDPTTEANKKVNDYFGGQNVNEVLSEAAQRKVSEFSTTVQSVCAVIFSAIRFPRRTTRRSP